MPNTLILVAEDQPDILEMMHIYLEIDGYSVIEARDGREADRKAVEFKPDLVFIDIAMPDINGIEAVRMIRKYPAMALVPIVAVSAYGSYFAAAAHDAGCDMLIRKPVELDTLSGIIERLLRENTSTADPAANT